MKKMCVFHNTGFCPATFVEYLHCTPQKCQYLKGHLAHRYWGQFAGDTGEDNNVFDAGVYDSLDEAVQAVKRGLAGCLCQPYWGQVIDLLTGDTIPVNP